jgi:hypothetical protein
MVQTIGCLVFTALHGLSQSRGCPCLPCKSRDEGFRCYLAALKKCMHEFRCPNFSSKRTASRVGYYTVDAPDICFAPLCMQVRFDM